MDKGLSETRTIPQTLRYECLWWPYKTHKRKNALYGFLRTIALRVALWKSSDIYRILFRIKLELN